MGFISDTVYQLKMDGNYSQSMILHHDVFDFDPATGANTIRANDSISKYIENVILLPLDVRMALFRAIHLEKEGLLQPGESQVIVDPEDIPGIKILPKFYLVDLAGIRYDVTRVSNVKGEVYLLTLQSPDGEAN